MHPLLVEAPGFTLPSYGAFVVLAALVIAGLHVRRESAGDGMGAWPALELFLLAALVGLAGARLPLLLAGVAPSRALAAGGYFDAGLLAGTLAALGWLRARRLPVLRCADRAVPSLLFGAAIGRLGCLAAGCCHGRPTTLPWGIVYDDPRALALAGVPLGVKLHPAPVYLLLFDLWLALAALRLERGGAPAGRVIGAFLLLEGVARLALGSLRGEASTSPAGPALAAAALALGLLVLRRQAAPA